MTVYTGSYADAKIATQGVYQRQAKHWHTGRSRDLYERHWLDRFIGALPQNARVLDLGCGTGDPVGKYMLQNGFDLVGVDYAPAMIERARALFPSAQWHVGDIKTLEEMGAFDGIYSWDGFFHLSMAEQRIVIPNLARRIR